MRSTCRDTERFWHFTCATRTAKIVARGMIDTASDAFGADDLADRDLAFNYSPHLVWLARRPDATAHELGLTDQRWMTARFEVHLPRGIAISWDEFSRRHRNAPWRSLIERDRRHDNWWVVDRSIAISEIRSLHVHTQAGWVRTM